MDGLGHMGSLVTIQRLCTILQPDQKQRVTIQRPTVLPVKVSHMGTKSLKQGFVQNYAVKDREKSCDVQLHSQKQFHC